MMKYRLSRPLFLRILILASAFVIVLFGFMYATGNTPAFAQAGGYYSLDLMTSDNWDSWWCTGTTGNCSFVCNSSNVGRTCNTTTCLSTYQTDPQGSVGNIRHNNYTCQYHGPACTPDSSCSAGTCSTGTCSDSCGNVYTGTMNCSVPCTMTNSCGQSNSGTLTGSTCSVSAPPESGCPATPTCTGLGYYHGNYPSCYSLCSDVGEVGTWPYCVTPPPTTTCADVGMLGSPYPSGCYAPPADTCANHGLLGSPYPSGCYSAPPANCAANGCTAASTCSGSSCVDSCGATVSGTNTSGSCTVPPTGNPTCTNPAVTIVASATRVNSGTPINLTVTGSGLNQSCTVTGTGSGSSMSQTLTPTACNLNPNPTTIATPPITTQSTFTVTCVDGPAGSTFVAATASTIVNINPTFKPF